MAKETSFILVVRSANGLPVFDLNGIDPTLLHPLKWSVELKIFENLSCMRELRSYINNADYRDISDKLRFDDCKSDLLLSMKKAIEKELLNRNSQLVIF